MAFLWKLNLLHHTHPWCENMHLWSRLARNEALLSLYNFCCFWSTHSFALPNAGMHSRATLSKMVTEGSVGVVLMVRGTAHSHKKAYVSMLHICGAYQKVLQYVCMYGIFDVDKMKRKPYACQQTELKPKMPASVATIPDTGPLAVQGTLCAEVYRGISPFKPHPCP